MKISNHTTVQTRVSTLYIEASKDVWSDLSYECVQCMQAKMCEIFPEGKPMVVEEVLVPIAQFRVTDPESLKSRCETLRQQIKEFLKAVSSRHGIMFTYYRVSDKN